MEDEGIFWPAEGDGRLAEPPKGRERIPMHPKVQLALAREELFFDQSMARFLQITDHTGSMQTACRQMHMSYTKGWKMLKAAEKQLGYPLLITQSGGAEGGSSQAYTTGKGAFWTGILQMEKELNGDGQTAVSRTVFCREMRSSDEDDYFRSYWRHWSRGRRPCW